MTLPRSCAECLHCVPRLLPERGCDVVEGRVCDPMGFPILRPGDNAPPPSWCPLRVPGRAKELALSLETANLDNLHVRVAGALGWRLEEVKRHSLLTLREVVRPVSAKLAQELGLAARQLRWRI